MEMAGAARGAVSSLLGSLSSVLVDEVKQLWGVRRELQSIKDEMESMNSFLLDLEEVDRPTHQQRTWMRQVRDLAYSAEHCVSLQQALILREGPPAKGLLGYLPPVRTLLARHRLAMEVRELKKRIEKVNERRHRYDVKVPGKPSGPEATLSSSQATGGGDAGTIPGDDERTPEVEATRALAFSEPRILEECTQDLVNWLSYTEEMAWLPWLKEDRFPSIAIAAPDKEDAADVALEALAHPSVATKFEYKFWITFPFFLPATPMYILEEILGKTETEELDRKIEEIVKKTKEHLQAAGTKWWSPRVFPLEPLDILCDILQELLPGPVQSVGEDLIEEKTHETAMKIKKYLEELDTRWSWIGLDHSDYVGILRELLPQPKEDKSVKEDMDRSGEDQRIEEITEKIKRILKNIKEHLEIPTKIKKHLHGKRIIIVLDGINYAYEWWETKRALNQLGCAAGSAVIGTTRYTQGSEGFCNPEREAIIYSLVHFYYRKVLFFTSRRKNKDFNEYILGKILQFCEPHEFCMKLFAYALYANPDKSREDLEKLSDTLVFKGPLDINADTMLMFSYGDLPRDYKTCFLYLAIFPRGHKIRRSTLVGQWIAEGLIATKDWTHSVHRAERCFDELVDRGLVYPCDIGAAGKVKSCSVDVLVIDFIAKTARMENFMDTGLSHHLTQHSIYKALRPEGIMVPSKSHPTSYIFQECIGELCTFCIKKKRQKNQLKPSGLPDVLAQTARSIELQMLKVLDFEGYRNLEHHRVLKHILKKMFLLRYLSLRNTDVTQLPRNIGKLQLLEILDIRQTKVHPSSTKHIVLPKLKRLLAGRNDQSTDTEKSFSTVRIPHRIKKMANLEVLSHVEASRSGAELKDIGKLWQLRKLRVVIKDENDHLRNLLQAISDLNECLQSLSITLPRSEGTTSSVDLPTEIRDHLRRPPKLLESLSISGITRSGQLLPLLAKRGDQLTKLTLHNTLLDQNDLKDLAKLPKLRFVRLQHKSYIASKLTFKNGEFRNLKNLLVEGSNMSEISFEYGAPPKLEKIALSSTKMNIISFENGAAPELEKIIFSFTDIMFLHGVDSLPKLEVELNGNRSPLPLFDIIANRIAKVTLRDTLLKQGDLQILAKKPNMRCLMLLDKSCDESQLTFNKDEFPKLSLLVVECAGITNISFSDGAAPKLEKIVWSFTSMESLSGIDNLPRLKELEFNGEYVPDQVIKAIEAHPNSPVLKHNEAQIEAHVIQIAQF